ncbi:MAG TPA: glycosyltransferase, partial [Acidimicrobiales bacterium]|nr:glycosyltransferase [Acidimicrobiales bacterium]
MPEEFVPPVVAVVVVAGDAGSILEECLESLAQQDYPALDVLVVDASTGDGVTNRVAQVTPGAFVRRDESARGFAQAANQALSGVEGASFFVFCRGDALFAPDAVRLLVQEAFRSNASIVGPKIVDRERPSHLVEVGLSVDRLGAPISRIEEGELDQAQHDEVREVFAVPTTGMLARVDLFNAVGGFDPALEVAGEDVDLCWRVRLAGARVVVAPQAAVGWRQVSAANRQQGRLVAEKSAQQRTALKNYGFVHRLVTVMKLVLLLVGDTVTSPLTGSRERAASRRAAWRWNRANRRSLRQARRSVRDLRQVHDSAVIALMGSRGLFRRVNRPPSAHAAGARWTGSTRAKPPPAVVPTGAPRRAGAATPHDSDRLTDLIVRLQHGDVAAGQAVTIVVLAVVVVVGIRGLLFGSLPVVGQLVPGPTGWRLVGTYFGGLGDPGWRGTQVASPAYGLIGLVGGVLGNSYGLAIKVVYLGGLVVGAIGMGRLVGDFGGGRSRLLAAGVFLASPLVWNAMGNGDLQASATLALLPWVWLRVARATGLAPFAPATATGAAEATPSWSRAVGEMVPLGLLLAVAVSLAPEFVVDYGLTVVVTALV